MILRPLVLCALLAPALLQAAAAQTTQQTDKPADKQTEKQPDKPGAKPGAKPSDKPPAAPVVRETVMAVISAPTAYRIVATQARFGTPGAVTAYRSGDRVLVDAISDRSGRHTRTLYDIAAHTRFGWNLPNSAGGCTRAAFPSDTVDPFTASVFDVADARFVGMDTLRAWNANVMEAPASNGGTARAWFDTVTNLPLKVVVTAPHGTQQTIFEATSIELTAQPDAIFAVPPACSAAQSNAAPLPAKPTSAGYTPAIEQPAPGPETAAACTVLFRVVRAGSLELLTSGFQTAIDLAVDPARPPRYILGVTPEGHVTFAGGELHEVTEEFHNGVLRIEHAPAQFEIDTEFGNGGSAHALVYRRCYGPETTLLFVVNNPEQLDQGGQWLWVRSGRRVAAAQP
jgi:hypothetical protein